MRRFTTTVDLSSRLDRLLERKPMEPLPLEEKEKEHCSKRTRSAVDSTHVMKEVSCIICEELTTAVFFLKN